MWLLLSSWPEVVQPPIAIGDLVSALACLSPCIVPACCALQDFKTAHLLGVCPRAQFLAMLLGSAASALVSVGAYSLYTSAWPVPGPEFPAPTAEIWLDMADLVG